jgi:transcriptional regulator
MGAELPSPSLDKLWEAKMGDPDAGLFLPGTLDLLVLNVLSGGAMHGWGISQKIQRTSEEVLGVNEGSLYPALHRLERKGWIESEWGVSENNRRAKFYTLTEAGEKRLARETESWQEFSAAVDRVLALT